MGPVVDSDENEKRKIETVAQQNEKKSAKNRHPTCLLRVIGN